MLGQRYTVKKGDTLWDLAGKYLGKNTDWPKIFEHNNSRKWLHRQVKGLLTRI